jgi:hypothetical protein
MIERHRRRNSTDARLIDESMRKTVLPVNHQVAVTAALVRSAKPDPTARIMNLDPPRNPIENGLFH